MRVHDPPLDVMVFAGPATDETVRYLSDGVSKPLLAGLLVAYAEAVGAGPSRHIVLLLDNAGFHTRSGLAVPDSIGLAYLPAYSPEPRPTEMPWLLVGELVVNEFVLLG